MKVTSRDQKACSANGAASNVKDEDPYGGRAEDDLEATVASGSEMQVMVPLNS